MASEPNFKNEHSKLNSQETSLSNSKPPIRLSQSLNIRLTPLKLSSNDIKELSNTALLSSIQLFNNINNNNNNSNNISNNNVNSSNTNSIRNNSANTKPSYRIIPRSNSNSFTSLLNISNPIELANINNDLRNYLDKANTPVINISNAMLENSNSYLPEQSNNRKDIASDLSKLSSQVGTTNKLTVLNNIDQKTLGINLNLNSDNNSYYYANNKFNNSAHCADQFSSTSNMTNFRLKDLAEPKLKTTKSTSYLAASSAATNLFNSQASNLNLKNANSSVNFDLGIVNDREFAVTCSNFNVTNSSNTSNNTNNSNSEITNPTSNDDLDQDKIEENTYRKNEKKK